MALSTYSGLQASVLNWLARDGNDSPTLAAAIPDFIAIAETKFNRVLRVAEMETTVALTAAEDGSFALPADFLEARKVATTTGTLSLVSPDWARDTYPTNAGYFPSFYTIEGSTLRVHPGSASTVELSYYQTIPALSDSNATNWLLTNHPDLYLFTALVEANAFAKDAEAAGLWNERAAAVVDAIEKNDTKKRFSRVTARVKGPTP